MTRKDTIVVVGPMKKDERSVMIEIEISATMIEIDTLIDDQALIVIASGIGIGMIAIAIGTLTDMTRVKEVDMKDLLTNHRNDVEIIPLLAHLLLLFILHPSHPLLILPMDIPQHLLPTFISMLHLLQVMDVLLPKPRHLILLLITTDHPKRHHPRLPLPPLVTVSLINNQGDIEMHRETDLETKMLIAMASVGCIESSLTTRDRSGLVNGRWPRLASFPNAVI